MNLLVLTILLIFSLSHCVIQDDDVSESANADLPDDQGAQIQAMFDNLMGNPLEAMMATAMQRALDRRAENNTCDDSLQQPLLAN